MITLVDEKFSNMSYPMTLQFHFWVFTKQQQQKLKTHDRSK